jgi:hypothetical protein
MVTVAGQALQPGILGHDRDWIARHLHCNRYQPGKCRPRRFEDTL